MLCVTGVHLRDITDTFSLAPHLNVSHLSIGSCGVLKLPVLPGPVHLMTYSVNETARDVKHFVGVPLAINCSVYSTLNVSE